MPLPRSSSLANPVASSSSRCFCGRSIDEDDESSIYCSTSCARLDSMSALCAQEVIETSAQSRMKQVLRFGGKKEALAKSSHYRRVERDGNRRLAGKGIGDLRAEKKRQEAKNTTPLPSQPASAISAPVEMGQKSQPKLKALVLPAKQAPIIKELEKLSLLEEQFELEDDINRYGEDDSDSFVTDLKSSNMAEGGGGGITLNSYFSSSSLASQLSSSSSSYTSDSSFATGEPELSSSSSSGSLASSTSSTSLTSSSSFPPSLSTSESKDSLFHFEGFGPSSPFLDSLFTPLLVQTNTFHSNLLSSSTKAVKHPEKVFPDSKADDTPRIGSKSPRLEVAFEDRWITSGAGNSSLSDFLKDF